MSSNIKRRDISGFDFVPIDKIIDKQVNARTKKNDDHINVLIASIQFLGLTQPISCFKNSNGEYVLEDGFHRWQAYKKLNEDHPDQNWDKIATVCYSIDTDTNEDATLRSFATGTARLDFTNKEKRDNLSKFFKIYTGDVSAIAEATGYSEFTVRKFVGYISLPKPIKDFVDQDGKENLIPHAVDTWNKYDKSTVFDYDNKIKQTIETIDALGELNPTSKDKLKTNFDPDTSASEQITKAKTAETLKPIESYYKPELITQLQNYNKDQSASDNQADIVIEKLKEQTSEEEE